jgi:hypothetical protein
MQRTFELSTHMKAVSRSTGTSDRRGWAKRGVRSNTPKHSRSATAAAAYRACCVIECDREGRTHDYRRKRGHEAGAIVHHRGAVARWLHDRMKLWNGAEMVERNGKRGKNAGAFKADARVARDCLFTFPAELSKAGRFDSAMKIARYLADNYLIGVDFNIHEPGQGRRRAQLPLPHADDDAAHDGGRIRREGPGTGRRYDRPGTREEVAGVYRADPERRIESRRQGRRGACRAPEFQGAGQRTGPYPASGPARAHQTPAASPMPLRGGTAFKIT